MPNRTVHLRHIVHGLLCIAGVALISFGITDFSSTHHRIALSCGGAFLATGLSFVVLSLVGSDLDPLFTYIQQVDHITSNPKSLADFHSDLYYYHVTQKSGMRVWMVQKIALEANPRLGTFSGKKTSFDRQGKRHTYIIDAAIRDDRLVLLTRPESGREPHMIAAIKGVAVSAFGICCGTELLQTWDGPEAIVPVLVSRTPINNESGHKLMPGNGDLASCDSAMLDQLWQTESQRQQLLDLLPKPRSG